MANAAVSDVFNCSVPEFYKIISDYEKYPQFLSEVKECHVLESQGNRKLVEFHVSMIKTFKYSLWITETEPNQIQWVFAKGDIFKQLDGGWKLADEAGRTRAEYAIEAKMCLFVPGPIAK
ncbi:MAG: type II toxin-antitoxin system RatA family toxin, partial [Bdellovibrionales bacterium]